MAALATLLGLAWQAADQRRPLDLRELVTSLLVAFLVAGGLWLATRSGPVRPITFARLDVSFRAAVWVAQAESGRLKHKYIGTGHLLLGLLADPERPRGEATGKPWRRPRERAP